MDPKLLGFRFFRFALGKKVTLSYLILLPPLFPSLIVYIQQHTMSAGSLALDAKLPTVPDFPLQYSGGILTHPKAAPAMAYHRVDVTLDANSNCRVLQLAAVNHLAENHDERSYVHLDASHRTAYFQYVPSAPVNPNLNLCELMIPIKADFIPRFLDVTKQKIEALNSEYKSKPLTPAEVTYDAAETQWRGPETTGAPATRGRLATNRRNNTYNAVIAGAKTTVNTEVVATANAIADAAKAKLLTALELEDAAILTCKASASNGQTPFYIQPIPMEFKNAVTSGHGSASAAAAAAPAAASASAGLTAAIAISKLTDADIAEEATLKRRSGFARYLMHACLAYDGYIEKHAILMQQAPVAGVNAALATNRQNKYNALLTKQKMQPVKISDDRKPPAEEVYVLLFNSTQGANLVVDPKTRKVQSIDAIVMNPAMYRILCGLRARPDLHRLVCFRLPMLFVIAKELKPADILRVAFLADNALAGPGHTDVPSKMPLRETDRSENDVERTAFMSVIDLLPALPPYAPRASPKPSSHAPAPAPAATPVAASSIPHATQPPPAKVAAPASPAVASVTPATPAPQVAASTPITAAAVASATAAASAAAAAAAAPVTAAAPSKRRLKRIATDDDEQPMVSFEDVIVEAKQPSPKKTRKLPTAMTASSSPKKSKATPAAASATVAPPPPAKAASTAAAPMAIDLSGSEPTPAPAPVSAAAAAAAPPAVVHTTTVAASALAESEAQKVLDEAMFLLDTQKQLALAQMQSAIDMGKAMNVIAEKSMAVMQALDKYMADKRSKKP